MNNTTPLQNSSKFTLTAHQTKALEAFREFMSDPETSIFILQGYAGTGKTTLIRIFTQEIAKHNNSCVLMTSTGRAAKILHNALHAHGKSYEQDVRKENTEYKISYSPKTVHSIIYSFDKFNADLEEVIRQEDKFGVDKTGQLLLNFGLRDINRNKSELQRYYIIDEASMVSDTKEKTPTQAVFGSGKLLSDLMHYDKYGKFIFVGDHCQLPPVQQRFSPALSMHYFEEKYKLRVVKFTLHEIVRQSKDNGIVAASQRIRKMYANPPQQKWSKLPLGNYSDIKLYSDIVSMINTYIREIKQNGYAQTTLIGHTNAKCNNVNKLVRLSLGHRHTLQKGDLLLVTQNNLISGLMNGDMVVVEQIKDVRYERAQLSFLSVEVRELITGKRYSQLLIEDIINGDTPNLTQTQQKNMFIDFYRRMKKRGIKQNHPEFNIALHNDEFLNALRCIYGYAITCHKAQGGEWDNVFIDIPRNITYKAKPSAYQWLYTAMTRAKKRLHIVNDFYISK